MTPEEPGGPAARRALALLVVVYVFNFLDRQILSILAERIKADLGLTDAQIGFLYGTAFAVFFAVFGIPLGRLADVWDRRRLIAIGLAFWSAMTTASGLARSFGQLALARVGVGVGEASANPAAYSLLSDLFPPARRATVLALYSSGIYIGTGLGLGIGGLIVERWDAFFGTAPPLGLRGWQVAFFAAGLPGLLLSLAVRRLPEPPRGRSDGLTTTAVASPLRTLVDELGCVLPPFTLVRLWMARGAAEVAANVAGGLLVAGSAWGMTRWLGNPVQWISLGIGLYAAFSWAQNLRLRDRPAFVLIFRNPSLRWATLSFALMSFSGYGWSFWMAPYLIRTMGAEVRHIGFVLGGIAASCGWLGITFGGMLADRLRRRSPNGRLYVGMLTAALPIPFALWLLSMRDLRLALAINVPMYLVTSMWLGPGAATFQDLVLPRMRAAASAAALLVITFIGLALGPYTIGRISVATGSLRTGLLCSLVANVLALGCAVIASQTLPRDEATKVERARAAGEPV